MNKTGCYYVLKSYVNPNKCAQSRLTPTPTLIDKMREVLAQIYQVPWLWKGDVKNLKDYNIWQSSNMNLFGVQRRSETAKPLQFLEFRKAEFGCSRNTRQQSVSVRRHKRNSLDPRKDNFLKLMILSSRFSKRDARLQ
jgi:hypothetical protein